MKDKNKTELIPFEKCDTTRNLLKMVNWDTAPDKAEEMLITLHWADKDSNIIKQIILVQENRP